MHGIWDDNLVQQRESLREVSLGTAVTSGEATDLLRTICDESGAVYALYWTMSGGKLQPEAEWSKNDHLRSFLFTSRLVSLKPGECAVGRVYHSKGREFYADVSTVSSTRFQRSALARRHGVRSVACVPWNDGVLEYGSKEVWPDIPFSAVPSKRRPGETEKIGGQKCGHHAAWEADIWKQSLYLKMWRRRTMRLQEEDGCLHLRSWRRDCFGQERLTGEWQLDGDLKALAAGPWCGFPAALEVSGVKLAAFSASEINSLKDFCSILKLTSACSRARCDSDISTMPPSRQDSLQSTT
eukprot:TRINITY_DN23009_c0_g1_i1.p1 TRINITY_DN23009_c0_g1~~TRINITY_DN23009_c0_g1_i1.p1  ORF type:complete len:297 (+),score=57.87 TRINITY_DN23009_c0_g1_i1:83-973(+)